MISHRFTPFLYALVIVGCLLTAASVNAGRSLELANVAASTTDLCETSWPDSGGEVWIATKLETKSDIAGAARVMLLIEENGYWPVSVIEVTHGGDLSCLVILSRRAE